MQPITHQIQGRLVDEEAPVTLLLHEDEAPLFLRYAILEHGTDAPIFPALAIDDWGNERSGLALYTWLYREGDAFPRAEVFGFDRHGNEIQRFLRDLELFFRYPCFVYEDEAAPVADGQRVETILLPHPTRRGAVASAGEKRNEPPPHVDWPLRHAAVSWRWVAPPEQSPL
ncbi:MAG: hypothetical protein R3272_01010 [Candidatus Promineifilaceae bacterium]|nr:hypothetical protein [Candidatus Promineifilaceae bacterium]